MLFQSCECVYMRIVKRNPIPFFELQYKLLFSMYHPTFSHERVYKKKSLKSIRGLYLCEFLLIYFYRSITVFFSSAANAATLLVICSFFYLHVFSFFLLYFSFEISSPILSDNKFFAFLFFYANLDIAFI